MRKKTKIMGVAFLSALLSVGLLGASVAFKGNSPLDVKGEDALVDYTLTLSKDTSDAFKKGWSGDVFTVKTSLGNPIRFKRVTANSSGVVSPAQENQGDALDLNFKAGTTNAYLFSLDPIQVTSSLKAVFKNPTGGSNPMMQVYWDNEVFTEKSEVLQTSSTCSIRTGTNRTWSLGSGAYLAFKWSSSGGSEMRLELSSLEIGYRCA